MHWAVLEKRQKTIQHVLPQNPQNGWLPLVFPFGQKHSQKRTLSHSTVQFNSSFLSVGTLFGAVSGKPKRRSHNVEVPPIQRLPSCSSHSRIGHGKIARCPLRWPHLPKGPENNSLILWSLNQKVKEIDPLWISERVPRLKQCQAQLFWL